MDVQFYIDNGVVMVHCLGVRFKHKLSENTRLVCS